MVCERLRKGAPSLAHLFLAPRVRNARGAVILLSTYFVSLSLLLLSTVMLQRVMTEVRSTEINRDQAQAFFLAEGALDQAVADVTKQYKSDNATGSIPPYSVATPFGTASYTLETIDGQVFSSGKQVVTRRVTTTGTKDSVSSKVSAIVQETSPLNGVWANGLAIANGGGAFRDIYLSGGMRALRGAIASVVADPSLDSSVSRKALIISGLTMAEDHDDLEQHYVSPELMSLKKGYMVQQSAREEQRGQTTYQGVDYPGMHYVSQPQGMALPHVEGDASVGTVTRILPIGLPSHANPLLTPQNCSGELPLSGPTEITDGFEIGNVRDLSSPDDPGKRGSDGRIVLCAKAIYPLGINNFVFGMMQSNNPPELTFRKPTTLYLTGSRHIDVNYLSASGFTQQPDPFGSFVAWVMSATYGMQPAWDISLGAKVSAKDQFNRTIPNGINILWAQPPSFSTGSNPPGWGQPGVVWVKPGKFSGSIFAPNSLVLFRERDEADRTEDGELVPLEIGSVVGDEVIIELKSDHMKFVSVAGETTDEANENKKDDSSTTEMIGGWMNRTPAGP